MTILSLSGLREAFRCKCVEHDLGDDCIQYFKTSPTHDGGPHIELKRSVFSYVVTERGIERERRRTNAPDDIMYWLFDDLMGQIAQDNELNNRRDNEDSRRQWFASKEKLLRQMDPTWGDRWAAAKIDILAEHPFSDNAAG